MRALVIALIALLPLPALAQQDFGLRVTPEGLDAISAVALSRLPSEVVVPAMDAPLYDCPGSRVISAQIPNTPIALGVHGLDLHTEDGRIVVSTMIDVSVATPVTLHNPYACLGEATCDLSAAIMNLGATVELAAGTSPDGGIAFHGATVDIALTPEDLSLESDGCAVGEVATWLFNAFEGWALDLLIPRLEAILGEGVGAALTDVFANTVGLTIERAGFSIEGWLDQLDLDQVLGVTAGGGVRVLWTGSATFGGEAPAVQDPEGDALPPTMAGMFQVAASDKLVTTALYEAWRGGVISRMLADRRQSITLGGPGAAQQIGLPDGTELDIAFDIEEPLAATFGRETPGIAKIALRGLHVTVDVRPPEGVSSTIELRAEGSLDAGVTVDQNLGALVLDVRGLEIERAVILGGSTELVIDGAALRGFVAGTVMPMVSERLSGLPIAPALHSIAGTFLYVRSIDSSGGWQRVGVDVFVPDTNDHVAPETSLRDPADLLGVGTAAFAVAGSDDHTPTALLRYRAWLDGAPVADGVASGIAMVRFDATDGEHVLEVAAVDMNDNEDGTRATHTFLVDSVPPTLDVLESPPAIVLDAAVHASWQASDEGGRGVETSWQLRSVLEDGTTIVVQEAPFGADRGELAISTDSLDVSELYELEIIARDAAGNVSSQRFGFALHPSLASGCSASGMHGASPLPAAPALALAFVLGGLLWRRRR